MDYHLDFLPYIRTKLFKKLTVNFGQKRQKHQIPRYTILILIKEFRHQYPYDDWTMQTMCISSGSSWKSTEKFPNSRKSPKKYNLQVNQSKTENTIYHKDTDLRKTKKGNTTKWMRRIPTKKTTRNNGPAQIQKNTSLQEIKTKYPGISKTQRKLFWFIQCKIM